MDRKSKIIKSQSLAETQKKFIYGVITLIVFTLTIIFIFGDHGLFQLYKLKKEKSSIQAHISELRKEREVLISEKKRLENDLMYIEKLAREKYRMAKPGERVYKVISK
jgi:cell division protein FtsB